MAAVEALKDSTTNSHTHIQFQLGPEFELECSAELLVGQFTNFAIRIAGYRTPIIPSIIAVLRARADIGTKSPYPIVVSVEKLK